jgi:hypothetical protein
MKLKESIIKNIDEKIQSESFFRDFILKNRLFNVKTLRKNGNKTGQNTSFYKENEKIFSLLLEKHNNKIFAYNN